MRTLHFHGAVLTVDESGQVVRVDASEKQPAINMALTLFTGQDRVLVAGCGMGWVAARIAGVAGAVIAYEANPTLADLALTNVYDEEARLDVRPAALGLNDGWATLQLSSYWPESHLVDLPGVVPRLEPPQIVTVPVRDISAVVLEEAINALALDVEGAEHDLFLGISDQALGNIQKILLELHTSRLWDEGAAILQRLRVAGFIETRSELYFTRVSLRDHRLTDHVRGMYKTFLHRSLFLS